MPNRTLWSRFREFLGVGDHQAYKDALARAQKNEEEITRMFEELDDRLGDTVLIPKQRQNGGS